MNSGLKVLRKILYAGMHFDYGRPSQGTSFEFNNFYRTLQRIVPSVVEFDFMSICQESGREAMNAMLLEVARREQPDLIFFIPFTDQFDRAVLRKLTAEFTTFNWFCDDHWRFSSYSRHYAPCFTYVSTTDPRAIERYRESGYEHALLTQWGCNHFDYAPSKGATRDLDVTFVGQPHGNRRKVIRRIENAGVPVQAYGQGWPHGRISQDEMISVFNRSKINLNLSNSSWNIHSFIRGRQQIKGRNFEIPGCGGFLLSNYVEGIGRFYEIDREIVCFDSPHELLEKIQFYRMHDSERERIARAGYERTVRDHTYERRFNDLFRQMGFQR